VPGDLTVTHNNGRLSAAGYQINTIFNNNAPMRTFQQSQSGGGGDDNNKFTLEGLSNDLAVPAGLSYMYGMLQNTLPRSSTEDTEVIPDTLMKKLFDLVSVEGKRSVTRKRSSAQKRSSVQKRSSAQKRETKGKKQTKKKR